MAIGKEAPLDICVESAACRAALEASVEKFAAACEGVSVETIRRRLRAATIERAASPVEVPTNGHAESIPVKARK
jgi:hypothetical protein